MNLRDKYLSTRPGKLTTTDVDGWGTVYLRSLTIAELDELADQEHVDQKAATLLAFTRFVVDGNGARVFSDDDVDSVRGLPAQVVAQVVSAGFRASSVGPDAVEEAKKN
jgi:hypothetical protein